MSGRVARPHPINSKENLKEYEETQAIVAKKCKDLASLLKKAKCPIVYTGAGISTAARIPDYRGSKGLYTLAAKGVDISENAANLIDAQPTTSHMILKELYRAGIVKHILSQNCDGLHLRSGLPQKALSEIHGNMFIEVCPKCEPNKQFVRNFDVTERSQFRHHTTGRSCNICCTELIDTIVHFGEIGKLEYPLNWRGVHEYLDKTDLIICIGTSLTVLKHYKHLWPKAGQAKIVIINLQWTPKDKGAYMKINATCDKVMHELALLLKLDVRHYCRDCDPVMNPRRVARGDELINRMTDCSCHYRPPRGRVAPTDRTEETIRAPGWWQAGIQRILKRDLAPKAIKSANALELEKNDEWVVHDMMVKIVDHIDPIPTAKSKKKRKNCSYKSKLELDKKKIEAQTLIKTTKELHEQADRIDTMMESSDDEESKITQHSGRQPARTPGRRPPRKLSTREKILEEFTQKWRDEQAAKKAAENAPPDVPTEKEIKQEEEDPDLPNHVIPPIQPSNVKNQRQRRKKAANNVPPDVPTEKEIKQEEEDPDVPNHIIPSIQPSHEETQRQRRRKAAINFSPDVPTEKKIKQEEEDPDMPNHVIAPSQLSNVDNQKQMRTIPAPVIPSNTGNNPNVLPVKEIKMEPESEDDDDDVIRIPAVLRDSAGKVIKIVVDGTDRVTLKTPAMKRTATEFCPYTVETDDLIIRSSKHARLAANASVPPMMMKKAPVKNAPPIENTSNTDASTSQTRPSNQQRNQMSRQELRQFEDRRVQPKRNAAKPHYQEDFSSGSEDDTPSRSLQHVTKEATITPKTASKRVNKPRTPRPAAQPTRKRRTKPVEDIIMDPFPETSVLSILNLPEPQRTEALSKLPLIRKPPVKKSSETKDPAKPNRIQQYISKFSGVEQNFVHITNASKPANSVSKETGAVFRTPYSRMPHLMKRTGLMNSAASPLAANVKEVGHFKGVEEAKTSTPEPDPITELLEKIPKSYTVAQKMAALQAAGIPEDRARYVVMCPERKADLLVRRKKPVQSYVVPPRKPTSLLPEATTIKPTPKATLHRAPLLTTRFGCDPENQRKLQSVSIASAAISPLSPTMPILSMEDRSKAAMIARGAIQKKSTLFVIADGKVVHSSHHSKIPEKEKPAVLNDIEWNVVKTPYKPIPYNDFDDLEEQKKKKIEQDDDNLPKKALPVEEYLELRRIATQARNPAFMEQELKDVKRPGKSRAPKGTYLTKFFHSTKLNQTNGNPTIDMGVKTMQNSINDSQRSAAKMISSNKNNIPIINEKNFNGSQHSEEPTTPFDRMNRIPPMVLAINDKDIQKKILQSVREEYNRRFAFKQPTTNEPKQESVTSEKQPGTTPKVAHIKPTIIEKNSDGSQHSDEPTTPFDRMNRIPPMVTAINDKDIQKKVLQSVREEYNRRFAFRQPTTKEPKQEPITPKKETSELDNTESANTYYIKKEIKQESVTSEKQPGTTSKAVHIEPTIIEKNSNGSQHSEEPTTPFDRMNRIPPMVTAINDKDIQKKVLQSVREEYNRRFAFKQPTTKEPKQESGTSEKRPGTTPKVAHIKPTIIEKNSNGSKHSEEPTTPFDRMNRIPPMVTAINDKDIQKKVLQSVREEYNRRFAFRQPTTKEPKQEPITPKKETSELDDTKSASSYYINKEIKQESVTSEKQPGTTSKVVHIKPTVIEKNSNGSQHSEEPTTPFDRMNRIPPMVLAINDKDIQKKVLQSVREEYNRRFAFKQPTAKEPKQEPITPKKETSELDDTESASSYYIKKEIKQESVLSGTKATKIEAADNSRVEFNSREVKQECVSPEKQPQQKTSEIGPRIIRDNKDNVIQTASPVMPSPAVDSRPSDTFANNKPKEECYSPVKLPQQQLRK